MFRIASLFLVALTFLAGVPTARADRVVGACRPTTVKFAATDTSQTTSSGSFVLITGMSLNFVQGGSTPSCVILEFQAQLHAPAAGNALLSINAILDNDGNLTPINASQPQLMENSGMWNITNSIKLIWLGVAPGTHNLKVYFRSANGGSVEVTRPTMLIYSAP